jgi:hypothetical protein
VGATRGAWVSRHAWVCTLAVAVVASAAHVRADEASGTWTGVTEVRGNYYWERSTRVVAPRASVDLESPSGARIHADYLVDSITSASIAAGTQADVAFTEIRHEVGLGTGYEFDFGDTQLDVAGTFRVSREPDYRSLGGGFATALSLNDRSTVLRLRAFVVRDRVEALIRGFGGVAGQLSDRGLQGHLNAVVTTFVWEQVLSPVLTAQIGYDFGYMWGFLQNPYRLVPVSGIVESENHPDVRHRHTVTGRLAYYVRATGTALHAIYRTYVDSWNIAALNPEGRIYQEVGPFTVLRVRYRHYNQTRSFFYKPAEDYRTDDVYVTADPKMSRFHSHLLGFQVLLKLAFLERSFLDFARQATVDMGFDYIWNTNRFGNGVIATLGFRMPF